MAGKTYVPERGDIVWISLSPTRGHEQSGSRPVVVLSKLSYNERSGLALVCPITTKEKKYPFEVSIQAEGVIGFALADHVRSIDWRSRRIRLIGKISHTSLSEITDMIVALTAGI